MNFSSKNEKFLQKSVALLLLVASPFVGFCVAQNQKETHTAPAPPRPSAPRVSTPHASTPRSGAPASRPSNVRPSTAVHPTTAGTRPGTTAAIKPGTTVGRAGPGTTSARTGSVGTSGKTGTTVAGKNSAGTVANGNGRGPVGGRAGAPSAMGKTAGTNVGGVPNGAMARNVNRPAPVRQVALRGGGMATIRPNGQIRSINRNGMQINHGLNGSRRIESTHNGARIVTTGRNSGFVQRAYVSRNGHSYVSRTVVVNHVTYTTVYRSYSYHGYCCYYGYHPAYYYGPAYYGWAYNPWPAPVYYGWGWGGAPWYGYYGGYFAPYPVYPSAAFWLTDYVIAANLQAAYQAQAAANAAAANNAAAAANNATQQEPRTDANVGEPAATSGAVTLSPEVKAAIAEEVKAQLATEQAAAKPASSAGQQQAAASEEVPPALDPARRTFVVSSDLAVSGDGQECQLTAGDVITRLSDTPDDDRKVTVSVSASKKIDCAAGKQVAVSVEDLQEMHNHFQEQLDNGMKDLASKQGTSGLPRAPEATPVASDVPPPPPDRNAEKALQDQQAAADQTEAQVVKEAFSQGS
jgi:hypothetical protein